MNTTPEQDERLGLWSASSAERVHYCAGSVALINSIPKEQRVDEPTDAAESGTRIHAALETSDASDLDMTEAEITQRLNVLEVEVFAQWVQDTYPESDRDPQKPPKTIRESRMWILNRVDKITSAKVDVAFVHENCGCIIDFKSGFKTTTPASRNFQAKVQAVALALEYGISNVRVVIAQHRFTSMVTQADYDEKALRRALQEITFDDWRSKQPDAPRVPGTWCSYCPAKAWCSEFASYSLVPSYRLVGSPNKELLAAYVESLRPEDLAYIEKRRLLATGLFEAVKARLKALPKDELARAGFELSDGRNQMKVISFNGLIDYLYQLHDSGLLTADEFAECFTFKVGPLEENYLPRFLAKTNEQGGPEITAKEAKAALRTELSRFVSFDDPKNRTAPVLKELK